MADILKALEEIPLFSVGMKCTVLVTVGLTLDDVYFLSDVDPSLMHLTVSATQRRRKMTAQGNFNRNYVL